MNKQIVCSRLLLVCTVLSTSAYTTASAQSVNTPSGSATSPPTAVVLRFALQSESTTDATALSSQACGLDNIASASAEKWRANEVSVDSKTLDAISNELQKRLSAKKMFVIVDPDASTIATGSVVVSGCLFEVQKGNAVGRLIGMGLGASKLGAHVVLLTKTETGFAPLDSFEVEVKGRSILPAAGPAGVAVNAAKEPHETLTADAKKLADRIVKKLNSDVKERSQTAQAG